MKHILIKNFESTNTTAETVALLEKYIEKGTWKRVAKYNENTRLFHNKANNLFALVGEDNIYSGVDKSIDDKIKAIKKVAKFYWTHDYGEIFYNPEKESLFIVGGDGGYGYSVKKPKEDEFDSIDPDKEFNDFPETKFLTDVVWEAESYPDAEEGYIMIGKVNTID